MLGKGLNAQLLIVSVDETKTKLCALLITISSTSFEWTWAHYTNYTIKGKVFYLLLYGGYKYIQRTHTQF